MEIENKIDWSVSPFFGLMPGKKTPKQKGWSEGKYRIPYNKLNTEVALGFVPPAGYCVVDADDEDSVSKVENLINKLGLKVFSYPTTRGKHFVFRKPKGEYFDKIVSQNGGTIFISSEYDSSKIDVKGGSDDKNGYVKVKDVEWRVNAQDLMDAFDNAPVAPYSLLLSKRMKVSLEEYVAGPRDDTFFRWVAKFRSKGWTKEQFVRFAIELKFLANDPETINETAEWAEAKWDSSVDMGGEIVDMTKEIISFDEFAQVKDKSEVKEKTTKKKERKEDESVKDVRHFFMKWTKQRDNFYQATDIKDYEGLANAVISDTMLQYSSEDDQIWGFEEIGDVKEFKPISKMDLFSKRWLIKQYGNVKPSVFGNLKSYLEGIIPVKKFDDRKFLVSFNNKNIDVRDIKETELQVNTMNQNIIPHVLIDKSALETTHKDADEFLKMIMNKWTKNSTQLKKQIYERVGLSMTKYMGFEKAIFLRGVGSNGKSIFLELLTRTLGEKNISNEDLKELSNDRFSSSEMYGKLANINSDISGDIINDPSLFKKIVSGDRISASYKGISKFSFSPYALQIFGANNIPYAKEGGDSDAINRRIEIIPFLTVFGKDVTEKEKVEFGEKMKDEKLIEVFIYHSVNAVSEALNSSFTTSKISEKEFEEMKKEFNHLYDFIEECGIRENESITQAHKRYVEWAKDYEFKTFGRTQFTKKYINVARNYDIFLHKETFDGKDSSRHRIIAEREDDE